MLRECFAAYSSAGADEILSHASPARPPHAPCLHPGHPVSVDMEDLSNNLQASGADMFADMVLFSSHGACRSTHGLSAVNEPQPGEVTSSFGACNSLLGVGSGQECTEILGCKSADVGMLSPSTPACPQHAPHSDASSVSCGNTGDLLTAQAVSFASDVSADVVMSVFTGLESAQHAGNPRESSMPSNFALYPMCLKFPAKVTVDVDSCQPSGDLTAAPCQVPGYSWLGATSYLQMLQFQVMPGAVKDVHHQPSVYDGARSSSKLEGPKLQVSLSPSAQHVSDASWQMPGYVMGRSSLVSGAIPDVPLCHNLGPSSLLSGSFSPQLEGPKNQVMSVQPRAGCAGHPLGTSTLQLMPSATLGPQSEGCKVQDTAAPRVPDVLPSWASAVARSTAEHLRLDDINVAHSAAVGSSEPGFDSFCSSVSCISCGVAPPLCHEPSVSSDVQLFLEACKKSAAQLDALKAAVAIAAHDVTQFCSRCLLMCASMQCAAPPVRCHLTGARFFQCLAEDAWNSEGEDLQSLDGVVPAIQGSPPAISPGHPYLGPTGSLQKPRSQVRPSSLVSASGPPVSFHKAACPQIATLQVGRSNFQAGVEPRLSPLSPNFQVSGQAPRPRTSPNLPAKPRFGSLGGLQVVGKRSRQLDLWAPIYSLAWPWALQQPVALESL